MYTTGSCPFCVRAKQLLNSYEVIPNEIRIDTDDAKRSEMMQKTGGIRTVPQIFIDEHYVGGCDALTALHKKGELRSLLGLSGK